MKTFLATASVLGLMASAAMADCAGHAKVNAAADVDKTATATASVADDGDTVVAAKKKPVENEASATQ